MISVEKLSEGVRHEGLNYGLPMLFVNLGLGKELLPEDLVREILILTKCRWVCFLGEDTTKVGMGTLVKGLSVVSLQIEIEVSGSVKDPGWLHTVDRWMVDYVEDGLFNYGALRSQDMIRFTIDGVGDLSFIKSKMDELKAFPGTKVLKLNSPSDKNLALDTLVIARSQDRCRIY